MNPFDQWLVAADRVFSDDEAPESRVDELLQMGLAHEPLTVKHGDPVRLARVIAALRARQAAAAVELAELSRRRAEVTRANVGARGYLNAATTVSMHLSDR